MNKSTSKCKGNGVVFTSTSTTANVMFILYNISIKKKVYSSSGHPRCMNWFFTGTDLEKCSITLSPMDPLRWMGAIRMRVHQLTADKKQQNNPQVIHTTLIHQLTSCEMKSCKKKNIHHQGILTLIHQFWPKYNNASSCEKVNLLLSSHKIHQHICLELFSPVNGDFS